MNTEKLVRSTAVFDRILKIAQGFALAGCAVSLIFVPLTAILGERIIADASVVSLGNLSITMAGALGDYLDVSRARTGIILSLLAAVFVCAAAWYCLRILRQILAPMKEGRPFSAGIADSVRKLAWAVLIGGGVGEIVRTASAVTELKAYDLSFLTASPSVASVTYNFTLDLWFVAAALILFFLSHVFRCGEALQQESDETL